jgi:hypothetical protein
MQDEMISALVRQATDPVQYDHGNIDWIKHGTIANPLRIFFLGALYAAIGDLAGKSVLEIGSGTGWLLDDFFKLRERKYLPVRDSLSPGLESGNKKHPLIKSGVFFI